MDISVVRIFIIGSVSLLEFCFSNLMLTHIKSKANVKRFLSSVLVLSISNSRITNGDKLDSHLLTHSLKLRWVIIKWQRIRKN